MYVSLYVLSHSHFPYITSTKNLNAAFASEGISIEKTGRNNNLKAEVLASHQPTKLPQQITSNFLKENT